jgi:hypothetical protein
MWAELAFSVSWFHGLPPDNGPGVDRLPLGLDLEVGARFFGRVGLGVRPWLRLAPFTRVAGGESAST